MNGSLMVFYGGPVTVQERRDARWVAGPMLLAAAVVSIGATPGDPGQPTFFSLGAAAMGAVAAVLCYFGAPDRATVPIVVFAAANAFATVFTLVNLEGSIWLHGREFFETVLIGGGLSGLGGLWAARHLHAKARVRIEF